MVNSPKKIFLIPPKVHALRWPGKRPKDHALALPNLVSYSARMRVRCFPELAPAAARAP